MKVVNLTPHEVSLVNDKLEVLFFAPSIAGRLPRIQKLRSQVGVVMGQPLNTMRLGEPYPPVPEPEDGTVYIVSSMLQNMFLERPDLWVPDFMVRDNRQKIIGCQGFVVPESYKKWEGREL
jgi:hypothetical protein